MCAITEAQETDSDPAIRSNHILTCIRSSWVWRASASKVAATSEDGGAGAGVTDGAGWSIGVDVGAMIGDGVFVGIGVSVGCKVFVGRGVLVGILVRVLVGGGVLVGGRVSVGFGVEVGSGVAEKLSPQASEPSISIKTANANSQSRFVVRLPNILASSHRTMGRLGFAPPLLYSKTALRRLACLQYTHDVQNRKAEAPVLNPV